MARRRMISAELMRSDEFLALPGESQLLYVHLLVEADDDGFLLGIKRITTMLGLDQAAFAALVSAGFVLQFSTGAAVIAHWPVCNAIRKDRHTPTKYRAELAQLESIPEVGYVLKQEAPDAQKEQPPVQKEEENISAGEPVVKNTEPVVHQEEAAASKDDTNVQNETYIVQNNIAAVQKENQNVQLIGADVQNMKPAGAENPPDITPEVSADEPKETVPPAREFCPYAPPIPLASGEEYRLLQKDVDVWRRKFTDVNITEEFRKLHEYMVSRPDKRKTADEIGEYAEKWLARVQNKTAQTGGKKKHLQDESPPSYDIDLAEYLMNTRVPKLRKKVKS